MEGRLAAWLLRLFLYMRGSAFRGSFIVNKLWSCAKPQVRYDDAVVYGLTLRTSSGRLLQLGGVPKGATRARAVPCPADPREKGKYRVVATSGTADSQHVRSVGFVWAPL